MLHLETFWDCFRSVDPAKIIFTIVRHFKPQIQMTLWCKRRIRKTSECAEMISRSVTVRPREQFWGYLLIEFAPW